MTTATGTVADRYSIRGTSGLINTAPCGKDFLSRWKMGSRWRARTQNRIRNGKSSWEQFRNSKGRTAGEPTYYAATECGNYNLLSAFKGRASG